MLATNSLYFFIGHKMEDQMSALEKKCLRYMKYIKMLPVLNSCLFIEGYMTFYQMQFSTGKVSVSMHGYNNVIVTK